MKAATLFSGIGAPELACPDWQWLWHAEIEPFPSAVMAVRHPGSVNLGDVTAPDFVERALHVGHPDVVVFGSPCQSFSVAGKRGGMADARGNLALVGLEVVRRLRAPWIVWENVPGVLSGGFSAFARAVEKCGYRGCWRILDAQYFGVPQRRRRVFFVGYLGDWRGPAEVLFEPASLRGNPPPSREAGEDIAGTLEASAGGCDENDAKSGRLIAHSLRAEGFDASEDGTGRGTPLVPAMAFDARQSDVCLCGDRAAPLDTDDFTQAVAFSCKDHGADAGDLAPTLRAMGHADSRANGGGQLAVAWQGGSNQPKVVQQTMAVRRLTPLECERLQGLPDGWTAIAFTGKPAADGPRYRAIGNAMAVPVLSWILRRLERVASQQAGGKAA